MHDQPIGAQSPRDNFNNRFYRGISCCEPVRHSEWLAPRRTVASRLAGCTFGGIPRSDVRPVDAGFRYVR